MAEASYEDRVRREVRYIIWLANHPEHRSRDPQVRALAAAIAADIMRRADELGRKDSLPVETSGTIVPNFSAANVVVFPGVRR
jgi:hypothetical protein